MIIYLTYYIWGVVESPLQKPQSSNVGPTVELFSNILLYATSFPLPFKHGINFIGWNTTFPHQCSRPETKVNF